MMRGVCCILLATLILSLFALSSSFLPSKHITGWHRSKIQQIIPLLDQHRIRRIKLTPSLHVHGKELKQSQTSMIVDAACVGVGAVAGSLCRWQVGNIGALESNDSMSDNVVFTSPYFSIVVHL